MSDVLSRTVSIETAERDFHYWLEQLHLGETLTLVSAAGVPQAIVVSLQPASVEVEPVPDWETRWDALVQKVSRAWKSEKGAVETLAELRR